MREQRPDQRGALRGRGGSHHRQLKRGEAHETTSKGTGCFVPLGLVERIDAEAHGFVGERPELQQLLHECGRASRNRHVQCTLAAGSTREATARASARGGIHRGAMTEKQLDGIVSATIHGLSLIHI